MMTIDSWISQSALPRLEARMLLQFVLGLSRAQLITKGQNAISDEMLMSLNQLAKQRLAGHPMAYLLGEREFYGRVFLVNEHVLIPRPETEILVDTVLNKVNEHQFNSIWDLGTGSGIIACTLALENQALDIHASDVSQNALIVAQKNAADLGANVKFHFGSWYDVSPVVHEKMDILVSNPPYIEATDQHLSQGDLRFEPQGALTDYSDGLSAIRHLINFAPSYLKESGYLLMEHGYDQGLMVREYFKQQNCWQNIETIQDYANLDRITLAQLC